MNDPTLEAYQKYAGVAIRNWMKKPRTRKRTAIPGFFLEVLSLIGSAKRKTRVLDVGCGPGRDAIEFAKRGFEVVGVDGVPQFLEHANLLRRKHGFQKRLRFVRGDIRAMDPGRGGLGPGLFDLIWANASLIHLPKRRLAGVLKNLRRFLASDGILAAVFFHGAGEGVYQGSFVPGRFFARYRKQELREAFERAGWSVDRIKTVLNDMRRGRWLTVTARPDGLL